jgi:geranylgeranylglycerol-phosphate geranylgeranyltransferase
MVLFPRSAYTLRTVLAALSASLILAAGNAFNDVRDLPCDRINARHRPLPAGMLTPAEVVWFAAVLAVCGLLLSFVLGIQGVIVAAGAVILLFLYDIKLKGIPLLGNMVVSALGFSAFVYGGIAGNTVYRALIPAGFAFLFHLSREIVKDAADVRGDREAGLRTIATVQGESAATRLASFLLMALSLIVCIPFLVGYFGYGYFMIIALGIWPFMAYAIVVMLKEPDISGLQRIAGIMKIAMPVGIIAVLAGFQGL